MAKKFVLESKNEVNALNSSPLTKLVGAVGRDVGSLVGAKVIGDFECICVGIAVGITEGPAVEIINGVVL